MFTTWITLLLVTNLTLLSLTAGLTSATYFSMTILTSSLLWWLSDYLLAMSLKLNLIHFTSLFQSTYIPTFHSVPYLWVVQWIHLAGMNFLHKCCRVIYYHQINNMFMPTLMISNKYVSQNLKSIKSYCEHLWEKF